MKMNGASRISENAQGGSVRSFSFAEQAGGLQLELLQQVIGRSPSGYVITATREENNPIVFVNESFEKTTGYLRSDVLGRNASFLLRNDKEQLCLDTFREAKKINQQRTEIVRNYKADGSLFYNELTVTPVQNQSGIIDHLIWSQRDVTSTIKAEKEFSKVIADKDKRFLALMDNSVEAIWRLDFHPSILLNGPESEQVQAIFDRGIYTEINDVGANIYGYSMGSAVRGRLLKEFMDISRRDNVDLLLDLVQNEFTLTNAISKEKSADGTIKVIINNISPSITEGAVSHIWGTSLDITELYDTQEILQESKQRLLSQKKALEDKNIALKELITHIELEKKAYQDRISTNLQQMILPSLERIKLNKGEDVYIEEHRKVLNNLTSSFGQSINSIRSKLTPREMEVCNMVRNGMVSKDIARLLHIAPHTVEKHRRMARKKLGLTNKGVNLFSYLNSF